MNYNQVLQAIKNRDLEDKKIEKINKKKMIKLGLKPYRPGRTVIIDTGKIEGVDNVVKKIEELLRKEDRIITLEGISGSGKTSTAGELAKKIKAVHFSLGELFRYLTYLKLKNAKVDWEEVFNRLSYRFSRGKVFLYDNKTNISVKLAKQLRDPKIEKLIPKVAIQTQKPAIEFVAVKIGELAGLGVRIIIEGRAFTIDFLPCDLRLKLRCSAIIRAKRRLKQVN